MYKFYAEQYGVGQDLARRIVKFCNFAKSYKAAVSTSTWVNHGKVRVYVELWSQNKMTPFQPNFERVYYDAEVNELYVSGYFYQRTVTHNASEVLKWGVSYFSGAKTRKEINEMVEGFLSEKENWN